MRKPLDLTHKNPNLIRKNGLSCREVKVSGSGLKGGLGDFSGESKAPAGLRKMTRQLVFCRKNRRSYCWWPRGS